MVPAPHKRRKHHSGGGILGSVGAVAGWSDVLGPAMAGYGVATLEATDFYQNTVPSLPLVGKKGTVVLAMKFLGIGRTGFLRDVKIVLAALAGYELKKEGTISGF